MYSYIRCIGVRNINTGEAISNKYGHAWLDTDDYFWLPTELPFTAARERNERIRLLLSDIDKNEKCVISGFVCDWGDIFITKFDLCIWIQTPTEVRNDRIKKREFSRFGNRVMPGGDMYSNKVGLSGEAACGFSRRVLPAVFFVV